MSIFDTNPDFPGAVTVLHNAATSNEYSAALDVNQHEIFTFQPTGTWTGKVRFQGQVAGTSFYTFLPVFDTATGLMVPDGQVTANGIYRACVAGYSKVRTRVEPASGSVTVTGRLSRGDFVGDINRPRQNLLASVLNVVVAPGASVMVTGDIDISRYAFMYCGARADSGGPFIVKYEPRGFPGTFGQPAGFRTLLTVGETNRGLNDDWTPITSTLARFWIENQDDVSHNYDLNVYGIR